MWVYATHSENKMYTPPLTRWVSVRKECRGAGTEGIKNTPRLLPVGLLGSVLPPALCRPEL